MGMTLVLAGGFRERVLRNEEIGAALSVVVKPVGVEHSDEVSARGAHTLQVVFDPTEIPAPTAEPVLERWRWIHGGPVAGEMVAILRLLRRRAPEQEVEDRMLEVLGAVAQDARALGEPPAWLRRVREQLEDEPSVSVAVLARGVGVHSVSLSRAFRRHFGCSISDCRRHIRLRRAASLLERDVQLLSHIAHSAGYADHAHLCRDFRRWAGVPPSQYRALLLGADRAISVQATKPPAS